MGARSSHLVPDVLSTLADTEATDRERLLEVLPVNADGLQRLEAVFGRTDFQDVSVLNRAVQAAQAVCLLETELGTATAFLVTRSLVISNNHAFVGEANGRIASPEDAHGAVATFDFEQDISGGWKRPYSVECVPTEFFEADQRLDYAVVAVRRSDRLPDPIELSRSLDVRPHDDVFIVQHPNGGPKQVVISGNEVTDVSDETIGYLTDTLPGSSGSPVFDSAWRVVAIHRAARSGPDERNFVENDGTRADVMRRHLGDLPT